MPFDPLWVPVLTHYTADGRLDRPRTAAHLAHISPHVRQFLLGGTTGDGWDFGPDVLQDWLALAADPAVLGPEHAVLIGAFGAGTADVVAAAQRIEQTIEAQPLTARLAGLTVCAPVDPDASQAAIAQHFRQILAATRAPLAIYQLPQVVGCAIAPQTFAELAAESERITLFKDTSGEDTVARAGLATGKARLLRGAEGEYAAHLKPAGAYDGWLLSTANGFAVQLRGIAEDVAAGRQDDAAAACETLTHLVEALFTETGRWADALPSGNPFSNVNRAVDHVMAYGGDYEAAPARLVSGDSLPVAFLHAVHGLLRRAGLAPSLGYLAR